MKYAATACLLLTMISCKVQRLHVAGFAHYSDDLWWLERGAYVELFSVPLVTTATVLVNGHQALPYYATPGSGVRVFWDSLLPTPGTAQVLNVQTDAGNCTAVCTIPGGFVYTMPVRDTLPVGASLVISWTPAKYAQWYQVYISFLGFDTSFFYKETLFVVTTTNAAVPGFWFSGDGDAWIDVFAGNGPSPDPAAKSTGNVLGDGNGYWVGLYSIEKRLVIGEGARVSVSPGKHQREKLRRVFLRTS